VRNGGADEERERQRRRRGLRHMAGRVASCATTHGGAACNMRRGDATRARAESFSSVMLRVVVSV
jgi:hypothetical protein